MYVNLSQSPWQLDEADMIICPTVEVRKKGTAEWRLAFCLLGSSHRPDWGSQSWINLRLMVCRLPLLRWWKQEVIQSQVAPVYPYAAQTHVHLSHENLFSESQNPWKSQWVPQGSSEELTQDPGSGRATIGSQSSLISMQYYISFYNYKTVFPGSILS